MDLTGGAFYSQTPKSCLEDIGVNKGVKNYVILSKNCGEEEQAKNLGEGSQNKVKRFYSWLGKDRTLAPIPSPTWRGEQKLYSQNYRFENDVMCRSSLAPFASRWARGAQPAFTLAEVLVTLGVIGIVAAMTLPMLARNYNFYIRQQQFKKAYAAMNIAVQKTQIDMGEGVKCYYGSEGTYLSGCEWFFESLVGNLQVIKICDNNALNNGCISKDFRGGEVVYAEVQGGDEPDVNKERFLLNCGGFSDSKIKNKVAVYILNSGFSLITYYGGKYPLYPIFLLDINGLQGPNKWGHDIFVFKFYKTKKYDSVFILEASDGCHPLDVGGYYTSTFMNYLYGRNAEL